MLKRGITSRARGFHRRLGPVSPSVPLSAVAQPAPTSVETNSSVSASLEPEKPKIEPRATLENDPRFTLYPRFFNTAHLRLPQQQPQVTLRARNYDEGAQFRVPLGCVSERNPAELWHFKDESPELLYSERRIPAPGTHCKIQCRFLLRNTIISLFDPWGNLIVARSGGRHSTKMGSAGIREKISRETGVSLLAEVLREGSKRYGHVDSAVVELVGWNPSRIAVANQVAKCGLSIPMIMDSTPQWWSRFYPRAPIHIIHKHQGSYWTLWRKKRTQIVDFRFAKRWTMLANILCP